MDLIINSALIDNKDEYLVVGEGKLNEDIAKRFEQISKRKLNAEYEDLNPGTNDQIYITDRDNLKSNWTRSYSIDSMIKMIIKSNLENSSTINIKN